VSAASSRRWGLSITELAFAAVVADVDLVNPTPALNTSRARFLGLRVRDAALTYSYALVPGIALGVTGHALRGTTFAKEESVFSADVSNPFQTARDAFDGAERTRTRFTWDAGILGSVGPVRAAIVWKSINRPTFPFADEGPAEERGLAVTYGRQARIGAAAKLPILGILATADLDLTKNETLVPGLKSREVGGGVEVPLALFVFRGGMSVNLESPDRSRVVHAGFGVNAKLVRVDAGVEWRPGNSAVGGVLSVRAGL
jgi:hypothetical protein